MHSKAYGLCLTLFERGIKIVTLMDQEIYDLESINASLEKRLKLQLRLDSAHDYSRKLSVRIGAWWQNRREDARKGTRKASKVCPLWLEVVEGEFKPIAERIVVIIRVLEMSAAGMGKRKIASLLNNAKIPAFKGANGWHSSSVRRIIGNRARLGFYQPRLADGTPDGDEKEGYYPCVLDTPELKSLFWRAIARRDARKPTGYTSSAGRTGRGYPNLLKDLVRCQYCDSGLVSPNKGKSGRYLVCSNSQRARCHNSTHHLYAPLESELLDLFSRHTALFDYARILDRGSPQPNEIAATDAAIAERLATLDAMAEGFGPNAVGGPCLVSINPGTTAG